MAQDIQGYVSHIFRQRITAPAHKRQRFGSQNQIDRCTRAGPIHNKTFELFEAHVLRLAGGCHHADRIFDEGRIDIHFVGLLLQFHQLVGRQDLLHRLQEAGHALHNHKFFGWAGITNHHFQHEAIHLCFGQRIRAFGFDRVLGGHY